jgi:hypothetical protein
MVLTRAMRMFRLTLKSLRWFAVFLIVMPRMSLGSCCACTRECPSLNGNAVHRLSGEDEAECIEAEANCCQKNSCCSEKNKAQTTPSDRGEIIHAEAIDTAAKSRCCSDKHSLQPNVRDCFCCKNLSLSVLPGPTLTLDAIQAFDCVDRSPSLDTVFISVANEAIPRSEFPATNNRRQSILSVWTK